MFVRVRKIHSKCSKVSKIILYPCSYLPPNILPPNLKQYLLMTNKNCLLSPAFIYNLHWSIIYGCNHEMLVVEHTDLYAILLKNADSPKTTPKLMVPLMHGIKLYHYQWIMRGLRKSVSHRLHQLKKPSQRGPDDAQWPLHHTVQR